MIVDGKRHTNLFAFKEKGKHAYHLLLLAPRPGSSVKEYWEIPLEHGGNLATTPGSRRPWEEWRSMSWRQLPEDVRAQVKLCSTTIREKGTPMERDEHIYGDE